MVYIQQDKEWKQGLSRLILRVVREGDTRWWEKDEFLRESTLHNAATQLVHVIYPGKAIYHWLCPGRTWRLDFKDQGF